MSQTQPFLLSQRSYDTAARAAPSAVCPAVTLDGDGYDEFAIEALGDRAGAEVTTYVFYGGPLRSVHVDYSEAAFLTRAERWLTTVGDLNGDGLSDLVIGSGSKSLEEVRVLIIPGTHARYMGRFDPKLASNAEEDGGDVSLVVPLGDVDGDGFDDLAFQSGSPKAEYIKYGGPLSGEIR